LISRWTSIGKRTTSLPKTRISHHPARQVAIKRIRWIFPNRSVELKISPSPIEGTPHYRLVKACVRYYPPFSPKRFHQVPFLSIAYKRLTTVASDATIIMR
jgi:hypothetical protein